MDPTVIARGVQELKHDFTNGARVLATRAVACMRDALPQSDCAKTQTELGNDIAQAGYHLAAARPSMGAPITSAILAALDAIWEDWQSPADSSMPAPEPLARRARSVLDEQLERRLHSSRTLAAGFAHWVCALPVNADRTVRLLTLSSSSTLHESLVAAVVALGHRRRAQPCNDKVEIRILESRPACEGADFAAKLLKEESVRSLENCKITVGPESHLCMLADNIDALLVGADRVSEHGDVSNKTGSLAAAICTRVICPTASIVVLSETDKIAKPAGVDEHVVESGDPAEVSAAWQKSTSTFLDVQCEAQRCSVRNVYFEWVPSSYVDLYLTEVGEQKRSNISLLSAQKGDLEDRFFQHLQK